MVMTVLPRPWSSANKPPETAGLPAACSLCIIQARPRFWWGSRSTDKLPYSQKSLFFVNLGCFAVICSPGEAVDPLSSFPTVTEILLDLFFCALSYLFIYLFIWLVFAL